MPVVSVSMFNSWFRFLGIVRTSSEIPLLCQSADSPVYVHPLLFNCDSLSTLLKGFTPFTLTQLIDIAKFHCLHVAHSPTKAVVAQALQNHVCMPVYSAPMYAFADWRHMRRPRATVRHCPPADGGGAPPPPASVLPPDTVLLTTSLLILFRSRVRMAFASKLCSNGNVPCKCVAGHGRLVLYVHSSSFRRISRVITFLTQILIS